MIILDTNVVSEPMKANGAPSVVDWLDSQAAETLYLTAVNLAELLVGVEAMPAGKRREGVGAALAALIAGLFGARILPFNEDAARAYRIGRARRANGFALSVADAQSAAIATVKGFAVATNPDVFLSALSDVAKAKGMAEIARASGLGRESLYKALAPARIPGTKRYSRSFTRSASR